MIHQNLSNVQLDFAKLKTAVDTIMQNPAVRNVVSNFDDKNYRTMRERKVTDPISAVNSPAMQQITAGIELLVLSGESKSELAESVQRLVQIQIFKDYQADARSRYIVSGTAIINEVSKFVEQPENKSAVDEIRSAISSYLKHHEGCNPAVSSEHAQPHYVAPLAKDVSISKIAAALVLVHRDPERHFTFEEITLLLPQLPKPK